MALHVFRAPVFPHGSTEIYLMAMAQRAGGSIESMLDAKLVMSTLP